jgi:glutamyl/glutaminyl-tRNA synthetase
LPYLLDHNLLEKAGDGHKNTETGEEVSNDWLKKAVALAQERMTKLSDLPNLVRFLFVKKLEYASELLIWKKSTRGDTANNLKLLLGFLSGMNDFSKENLEKEIKNFIEEKKLGVGDILWPFRIALSGLKDSPPPFDIAEILGKEKVLERVRKAISVLE